MECRPDAVQLTVLVKYQAGGGGEVQQIGSVVRLLDPDEHDWPLTSHDVDQFCRDAAREVVERHDPTVPTPYEATTLGLIPLSQAPREHYDYEPDLSDPVTELVIARDRAEQERAITSEYGDQELVNSGWYACRDFILDQLRRDAKALEGHSRGLDREDAQMQAARRETLLQIASQVAVVHPGGRWTRAEPVTPVPSGPAEQPRRLRDTWRRSRG